MANMVVNLEVTSLWPHGPGCPSKSSFRLGALKEDSTLEATVESVGRGCRALCPGPSFHTYGSMCVSM